MGTLDAIQLIKAGFDFVTRVPYPVETNSRWRISWKMDIPKARFFLWHLEWQRLPTNVLRFQRGTATSPICSRCGSEQEA